MLNIKAYELYRERYGKKFWNLYREFENNQWLSLQVLTDWQNVRLRELVKHAYETVPYYQEIFKKQKLVLGDIQSIDDLHKLPLLTKKDIKQNYAKLQSSALVQLNR